MSGPTNTHYGVVEFSGDPAHEHDDPELHGQSPSLTLICAGPEAHCWESLAKWTEAKPLRMWETIEVVARDPILVQQQWDEMQAWRREKGLPPL